MLLLLRLWEEHRVRQQTHVDLIFRPVIYWPQDPAQVPSRSLSFLLFSCDMKVIPPITYGCYEDRSKIRHSVRHIEMTVLITTDFLVPGTVPGTYQVIQ